MAIYFPQVPATFIHIPKTGGQSFRAWLSDSNCRIVYETHPNHDHSTLQFALDSREQLGTTFTFVRNPFERLVSLFHFEKEKYPPDSLVSTFLDKGFTNWIRQLYHSPSEMWINQTFPWLQAAQPQTAWFSGKTIDIVIKLENINSEFKAIQTLFNDSRSIGRFNPSQHFPYRQYYNSETRSIVEELYASDLEQFNYMY